MDEVDIRRNRPTVAKIQGNSTAVLLGERSFPCRLSRHQFPTSEVTARGNSYAKCLHWRNSADYEGGDPDISLATYRRIIDLKTAELSQVACFLGPVW